MADEKKKNADLSDEQKRLFKYKRANVVLKESEVREIKAGRKRLRAEFKAAGIKKRKDFELTASNLGLYFDKRKALSFLGWLLHGRQLWALLGALATLLTVFFIGSLVTKMRGHFTINVTEDLFEQGLSVGIELEEKTGKLKDPSNYLFSIPLEDAPCTSIRCIPGDIHEFEGIHNTEDYFAYTFYVRNEGDKTVDFDYELAINSESRNLSVATWVMMIHDGELTFYAEEREDGSEEVLPKRGAKNPQTGKLIGYRTDKLAFMDMALYPELQFERIGSSNSCHVVPINFESDTVITSGRETNMAPGETHKYTIVLWLEGDDPDCTDELIGGHIGLEMNFTMIDIDEDK